MPSKWEERGNTDQRREGIENQYGHRAPSDREGHSTRTDFRREDGPARNARVETARQSSATSQLFKLALTGLGTVAAYKFLHRTGPGVEIANQFGKLGRFGRRGWNKIAQRFIQSKAATDPRARALLEEMRETTQSQLGEVKLISQLQAANQYVQTELRTTGTNLLKTDLGGALKGALDARNHAPSGYSMLNVGDVLMDKSVRGLVGRQQSAILQEGLGLGLITHDTQLGAGLFKTGGVPLLGGIKDTRVLLGSHMAENIARALDAIRIPIPFVDWRLGSIVRNPATILAPHKGITRVPRNSFVPGINKKIAHDGAFVIDGTLWAKSLEGYQSIATNIKPIFRSEHRDLFRVAGAMQGKYTPPEGSGGILGWIEKNLGVGPAYRTENSFLSSALLNPLRRLARGKPQLKDKINRKFQMEGFSQSVMDHYLQKGGKVAKDYGKVENIYDNLNEMLPPARFMDRVRASFASGRYTKYAAEGADDAIKGISYPKQGSVFSSYGSKMAGEHETAALVRGEHKWHMLANWMSMRPADLMSFTTGIAYKPGMGLHGWMKNTARLYGVGAGVGLGIEAARYLDYQMEDLTGFSPIEGAASLYVGMRVIQKKAADVIGVTGAAQYAEDLMPLSMTSTASGVARTVAPWLIGGAAAGPKGLAIGLAASALLGGPANILYPEDVLKSAQMYREEIAGERKVPIRKNRWWEFNPEEFSGGKIEYFKKHWYSEMKSDWQYSDVRFGSKKDYWKHVSPLPTPSNLFGLTKDEGWMGRMHAQDRPYPVIAGGGMSTSLMSGPADGLIAHPDSIQQKFSNIYESGTEFLGLYKFLGESILGIQAPFKHDQAFESSAEMTSIHSRFWDAELGGMIGMCFIAGTKIATDNGWKNIEEVREGTLVLSSKGKYEKVVGTLHRQAKDLVRIKLSNVGETLTGTSKHHIPIFKPRRYQNGHIAPPEYQDYKAKDTNMCDIQKGDYALVPVILENDNIPCIDLAKFFDRTYTNRWIYNRASTAYAEIYEIYDKNPSVSRKELKALGYKDVDAKEALFIARNSKPQRFPRFLKLEKELCYLLGWWVAEGSIEDNGRVSFTLSSKEINYAHELSKIIKQSFGATTSISTNGENSIVLRSCCIPLALLLTGLFGRGAKNKKVPAIIKTMPHNCLREFFKGIVLGDGWCSDNKAGYTSASASLCKDVFDVGLSLGVIGDLTLDYLEEGKGLYPQGTPRQDSMRSYVRWQNGKAVAIVKSILFDELVPDGLDYTQRSFLRNGYLFVRVIECEVIDSNQVDVFDLEIEDLHYYVASHILVHNTELLRRYLLPRNAMPTGINELPNLMPQWLPGANAVFDSDKRYFLNFHKGDPYRSVPHGEVRLPGPGYEALHRMHSGTPGVYDAMDRYLILADVAPHSRSFRHFRTIVKSWQKAGVLDKYWSNEVDSSEAQVAAVKVPGRYTPRRFTGGDKSITAINEAVKYSGFERAVGSAWEYATHDIVGSIPLLGSKLLKARTPLAAYKENEIYGEGFKNWADPYGSFIKPHFQMAIGEDPISGAGRGSMAMYMGATPLSRLALGVMGAAVGGGGSAVRAAVTGQFEGGWIPSDRRTEWDHMEYMDRLEYVRAKRLQGVAQMEGNALDAFKWEKAASRTMTGLGSGASIGEVQSAMPQHMKKYFQGLLEIEPGSRGEVMSMLPQHVRPAFANLWGEGTSGASSVDKAADYFSRHELPGDNWMGWHPNVPFAVSKIKMIDTAMSSPAARLHHYGLWEGEMDNHSLVYREMEAPSMELRPSLGRDVSMENNLRSELQGVNQGVFTSQARFGYGGSMEMNLKFDNTRRLEEYTVDYLRRF